MLENIDVRFFIIGLFHSEKGSEIDTFEVDHQGFVEWQEGNPHARVDVELHTVSANGARQLCITLSEVS